ncbi:Mitochondrial import inner membrane translocase subunit TIM8 [Penicillium subrubescens]|uniref:Mitochondrial import inner membrane translocase subunit n=1 Tax=Penicillium subrubescens TaxID=1316194 RepID=A0A1Q5SP46_9EURO|nr:Mitochondrial import inner membrane translocase subunit TIM8 [Penicillium subrubescens]KAJ5911012.1 Mitochondrial import inner membrane translocase subunit TIM8 [Penicillium subrubescens]OKO89706.1 Mitochondrial import inner membrane translocase subunit TIM8 [Penicillium subrubescens]
MDPSLDLSKLTDADKADLQQQLANEQQKATIQQTVHSLNETCFKKCMAGKSFTSGTLDRSEESCASNCVDRWMDSQMLILQKLGSMRGQ